MKGLTKKERAFAKDYVKTGNGTKSALKAYDTDKEATAASIASENLRKPKIESYIASLLPDELLAKVHLEGLQATKRSNVGGMAIGLDKDGDVESMGHTDIAEPDFAVRHKYLDTAYKVKGSFAPERKDVTVREQIPLDIV